MRCPYCAEDIKDEAIFCRYCRHDLTFFRLTEPMMERLSSLEDRVTEISGALEDIKASLEKLQSKDQSSTVGSSQRTRRDRSFLPTSRNDLPLSINVRLVSLVSLLLGGIQIIPSALGSHNMNSDLLLIAILLLWVIVACVSGLWLGISWRGTHVGAYAVIGAVAGILSHFILLAYNFVIFLGSEFAQSMPSRKGTFDVFFSFVGLEPFAISIVSVSMLFITGGLVGDAIERQRLIKSGEPHLTMEPQESAKAVAKRIVGSDEGRFYKATVEILKVLQPFVPVMTALLGIVAFLLGIQ